MRRARRATATAETCWSQQYGVPITPDFGYMHYRTTRGSAMPVTCRDAPYVRRSGLATWVALERFDI